MEVFVTRGLSGNSGFARAIKQAAANAVRTELGDIEGLVESEIEAEIAKDFNNGRTEDALGARRKEGATPLLGSIIVELEGEEFPFTINVGSEAEQHKVGALEFGSGSHTIPDNPTLLYFPSSRISQGKAVGIGAGRSKSGILGPGKSRGGVGSRGGKGVQLAKVSSVNHPGNKPYRFIRIGLERAIRRALGTR